MTFDLFIQLRDMIIEFSSVVIDIFDTTLADILPQGADVFFTPDILDATLFDFVLAGGILVIIGYNLAKWAIPFIE